MGYFGYSRLDENYPDKVYSSVRDKRAAKIILDKYIKDIEEFKKEISYKMTQYGSKEEKEALGYILSDLDKLILNKRQSSRLKITHRNLLRGIIYLWALGKEKSRNETIDKFQTILREINPKFDPRANALFHQADIVYQITNERASKMRNNLEKYHRDKITFRGKEVRLRKGVTDGSFKAIVENARSMSYTEALKEANRKTIFRDHFIPPKEFDEKEIDLQNTYKEFRKREKRRSKLKQKK